MLLGGAVIKAVFLDWYGTLVHWKPERIQILDEAYAEYGILFDPNKLTKAVAAAEEQVPEGNPLKWEESEDKGRYIRYQEILLFEHGISLPKEQILRAIKLLREIANTATTVLYEDVLPTLDSLKDKGYILGLLTNIERGTEFNYRELGLGEYFDTVVTSDDVGAKKPKAPIFILALSRANVNPDEAIYVGDQYESDVVGARGVGINPVLIDRRDLFRWAADCQRIRSLTELLDYLQIHRKGNV